LADGALVLNIGALDGQWIGAMDRAQSAPRAGKAVGEDLHSR
jgi:hydroxyethylthiazole kinase-like sugar kinase family protein